jgi:O-methyltransferase involved in polyketide biosynthesis
MDTPERPEPKPATAARIYDFYIGGTHNFPEDRAAAQAAIDQVPMIRPAARANRAFLGRAVRFAAEAGIRQFVDVGSGIPTEGNVHEIAQAVDPECRVVYVDIDPVAVAEGLEILADNPHATSIRGDVLDAPAILAHRRVAALIDFRKPVAFIMCALLHFVPDDEAAQAAITTFRGASAPGSYLILSHGTVPDETVATRERDEFAEDEKVVRSVYSRRTTTPIRMRSRTAVEAFFEGYDLVDPGLAFVGEWRAVGPDQPEFAGNSRLASILAGVGKLR